MVELCTEPIWSGLSGIDAISRARVCVCMCVCVCLPVCLSDCVLVFLICEITSKTEMIVVTESWVHCEIDLTVFLQMSFLILV